MKQHTIQVDEANPSDWIARCRCGWVPPMKRYLTRDMVLDEVRKHERQVERVRIAQRRGGGTLKGDYQHAAAMAANENVSEDDRRLWQQLADELGKRLGTEPTEVDQPMLFDLATSKKE